MIKAAGIASDMAARDGGSAMGVWDIFYNRDIFLNWQDIIFAKSLHKQLEAMQDLVEINTKIANVTKNIIEKHGKGAFFSGDHSGAVGIWSGVAEAKRKEGDIGLIWVDAHLDSHTPESSHSKNIHGMPMALLLGQGNCAMNNILSNISKLKPENICFIGIRSFENEEETMLKNMGCKIFYSKDIEKIGIKSALDQANEIVNRNTVGFGISFDIDGFDPSIAPGTGYIENGGLIFDKDFSKTLQDITKNRKFLGAEISEYIPKKDQNNKTINLIKNILQSCFNGICY